MRILFLTQIIPYPPDAGPKVKTWHVLRYLSESGHEITLVSFVRAEEEEYVPRMRDLCSEVHTVAMRRSRWKDIIYLLSGLVRGRSFLMERDNLPQMRAMVEDLLAKKRFDFALADQLTMTQFLFNSPGMNSPQRVFDAHNAVYTIVDRMMKEAAPRFLHPILRGETRRVREFEGEVVRQFEHTLTVTEIDKQHLIKAASIGPKEKSIESKIKVIPIAVDTKIITPIQSLSTSPSIMTLGTLHYPPNADGIRWFSKEVYPLIQKQIGDCNLTIVGKNPPEDFLQMAANPDARIKVTGYVPDLRPYLEATAVMVIPVRAGSGMRVRILEAFSAGIPVVTTTVGLEGIEAVPGKDVLVADTPDTFAEAVVRLLQNSDLRQQISQCSRRLAEEKYDWRIVLKKLDDVFKDTERN